ncbi:secreted protein [Melampsora americana]|nr:secreted protein [Melampsora americana]
MRTSFFQFFIALLGSTVFGSPFNLSQLRSPTSNRGIFSSCDASGGKTGKDSFHPGGDHGLTTQFDSKGRFEVWSRVKDIQSESQIRMCQIDDTGTGDIIFMANTNFEGKSKIEEIEGGEKIQPLISIQVPSDTKCSGGADGESCVLKCQVENTSSSPVDKCVSFGHPEEIDIHTIDQTVFGSSSHQQDTDKENLYLSNHLETSGHRHRRRSIIETRADDSDLSTQIQWEESRLPANLHKQVDPKDLSPVKEDPKDLSPVKEEPKESSPVKEGEGKKA